VPALPSSVLEPLWVQVAALLPTRHVHHPLGCHHPRVPDRVVFDKLIQILVFDCGYRRIADQACSATTLRRRDEWITLGVVDRLRRAVLVAYQRLFGLRLEHLAVDGCITKAPCGGQTAGPSPVDRRKQGHKRSTVTDAGGIPLGPLPQRPMCTWTPATTTRPTGRCWPSVPWSEKVATRAMPAPVQTSRRWPVERTHAWGNQYGKLRWCTERRRLVVEFWLALVNAVIVCGRLLRRAWSCYRWQTRPAVGPDACLQALSRSAPSRPPPASRPGPGI
jgi:transposase